MDKWIEEHLVCPRDYKNLKARDNVLVCSAGHTYPYIDGIPIMLLKEAKPTHGEYYKTFEQLITDRSLYPIDDEINRDAVDPYVQKVVAATCGIMFKPLINKLSRYPIPELPLPQSSGQYFLDIGCNWGRWCIAAARKGYIPIGIDPSLDAIRAARRVAKQLGVSVNYLVADARYLPFSTKKFDIVFSYSVL
jgi:2-polyprenyl-3-methyl-5-hydroxy-6-metoxy-1,4-benzoquinol methylase